MNFSIPKTVLFLLTFLGHPFSVAETLIKILIRSKRKSIDLPTIGGFEK